MFSSVRLTNDERRAEKDDHSRDELDSGGYEPDVGVGGCGDPLENPTGDDPTEALNDEEERHASGTKRSRGRLGCVGWSGILNNSDAEVLEDSPAGEYDPAAGCHFDCVAVRQAIPAERLVAGWERCKYSVVHLRMQPKNWIAHITYMVFL